MYIIMLVMDLLLYHIVRYFGIYIVNHSRKQTLPSIFIFTLASGERLGESNAWKSLQLIFVVRLPRYKLP
jgi:hypothetical protein